MGEQNQSSITAKNNNSQENLSEVKSELDAILAIPLYPKRKQKRRKFTNTRRPSAFWADIGNIENELRLFWDSINVPMDNNAPPTIPSESLLNHFERHDLRYAIANMGGRDFVSEKLGGARLVPGKWFEACETSEEVKCLLKADNPAGVGLNGKIPPIAPQAKRSLAKMAKSEKGADYDANILRYQAGKRWAHHSSRNPRGFWNEAKGRPSVWMARPSEITKEGRDDLKQAITRFGGANYICDVAMLIPYKEWRYFESNLELLVELQKYLIIHEDGREDIFPKLSTIQNNGHDRLYDLIMDFGGRKINAIKLNMDCQSETKFEVMKGLSVGKFSLGFAIRLMHFIRNEMLTQDPPLEKVKIQMPTVKELIQNGEKDLAKEMIKYGGHECIARRLNLFFDEDEVKQDAIARARIEAAEN
eukprot:scaffold378_cov270-Chaetoceros_neogracile.AAC.2